MVERRGATAGRGAGRCNWVAGAVFAASFLQMCGCAGPGRETLRQHAEARRAAMAAGSASESIDDMLALGAAHYDHAAAALLVEKERSPELDVAEALRRVDAMAARILESAPEDYSLEEALAGIDRAVFEELGATFVTDPADEQGASLASLLDTGRGNIGGLAILYAALAQRLGLDYELNVISHYLTLHDPVSGATLYVDLEQQGWASETSNYNLIYSIRPEAAQTPQECVAWLRALHVQSKIQREGSASVKEDIERLLRYDDSKSAYQIAYAQVLWANADYEGALRAADRAIALAPEFDEGRKWRLAALARLGEKERAGQEADEWLELKPNNCTAYETTGLVRYELEDHEKAVEELGRAFELGSKIAYLRLARGLSLMELGRNEEAAGELSIYLKAKPGDKYTLKKRAEAYYESGSYYRAAGDAMRATRQDSASKAAPLTASKALFAMWESEAFGAGGGDESEYPAETPQLSGDSAWGAAMNYLDIYLQRGGRNRGHFRDLAERLWKERGDFEHAEAILGVLIRADGDDVRSYRRRAQCREARGNLQGAIDDRGRIVQIRKDDVYSYRRRAFLYAQKDDYASAAAEYTLVLGFEPDNVKALQGRAYSHWKLGRYEQAVEDLTAALEQRPGDYSCLFYRGHSYYELDNIEAARRDFVKAIESDGEQAYAYGWGALAEMRAGELERAKEYIEKARSIEPGEVRWVMHRGMVHAAAGDTNAAMTDFLDVTERSPELKGEAQERMVELYGGE